MPRTACYIPSMKRALVSLESGPGTACLVQHDHLPAFVLGPEDGPCEAGSRVVEEINDIAGLLGVQKALMLRHKNA